MKSIAEKKADAQAATNRINNERRSLVSGVGMVGAILIVGPFVPLFPSHVLGIDKSIVSFFAVLLVAFVISIFWQRYIDTKPADSMWRWLKY